MKKLLVSLLFTILFLSVEGAISVNALGMMNCGMMVSAVMGSHGTGIAGKDIYIQNCARCHRPDRRGNLPYYPSLVDIKEEHSREEVLEIIDKGSGVMPSFSYLSKEQKEALVDFLFRETK